MNILQARYSKRSAFSHEQRGTRFLKLRRGVTAIPVCPEVSCFTKNLYPLDEELPCPEDLARGALLKPSLSLEARSNYKKWKGRARTQLLRFSLPRGAWSFRMPEAARGTERCRIESTEKFRGNWNNVVYVVPIVWGRETIEMIDRWCAEACTVPRPRAPYRPQCSVRFRRSTSGPVFDLLAVREAGAVERGVRRSYEKNRY